MILPKFDYIAPQTIEEAVKWLAKYKNAGVKILAGGTDLLVDMRGKAIPDSHHARCQQHSARPWQARDSLKDSVKTLVALSRIKNLRRIDAGDAKIRIGSMTTLTDLERSELIRYRLPALWDGARQLGSPLVRNRGTIGGNLCNARPAADTAIPTLALNGRLRLVSAKGERTVDHAEFVTAPGQTIMKEDEILTEIEFDLPDDSYSSAYIKLANRKALEISVVGAAAVVKFGKDNKIENARIALGAVAPKPLYIPEAGEALIGKEFNIENVTEAAQIAAKIAKPITDHRGGKEYRKLMVEVLVRRALLICHRRFTSHKVEESL